MRSYLGSQICNSKDVSAFEAFLTDLMANTSHLCQKLWLYLVFSGLYFSNRNWDLRCCILLFISVMPCHLEFKLGFLPCTG